MSRSETFSGAAPDSQTDRWIGRKEDRSGSLTVELAGMLGAAVTHPASGLPDLSPGAEMPFLWHWAAFPEFIPMTGLGPDGHPALGGFLPALGFQRRMWAGGQLIFSGRLHIGERLFRSSTIRAVTRKEGAAGPMAFVTVGHLVEGEQGGLVEETQDIVYLDIPDTFRPPKRTPVPDDLQFDETVPMNEARLFRYSAATFNAHRIHYDLPYTCDVEKYPALVVHGPIQATMLLDAAIRHTDRTPARFRYRGVHPMFHDQDLRLIGRPEPDSQAIDLGTAAPEDYFGLRARMEWET